MNLKPKAKRALLASACLFFVVVGTLGVVLVRGYFADEFVPAEPPANVELAHVLNRVELSDFDKTTTTGPHNKILLITLDTVRADHFSVYGYPIETTPFLESIASQGVVFERAFSPMATTAPSHATLLTGLYPLEHAATRNGLRLSSEILTLPEILSAAGFLTSAIVSTSEHFVQGNITQGFAHVDEPDSSETQLLDAETGEVKILRYRPANRTLSKGLTWLSDNHDRDKLFLWLHLFDAHHPRVRHPEVEQALFRDGVDETAWRSFVRDDLSFDMTSDTHVRAYRRYDTEIRFMDDALRSFFEDAKPYGIDDFLVIIVGDHGEGMGNHKWWDHGKNIYNELVRVPLIIRWPSKTFGNRIDSIVELTDLMPTILMSAGVSSADLRARRLPIEGMPLQYLLPGRDLEHLFGYALLQRRSFKKPSFGTYISYKLMKLVGRSPNYEAGSQFALLNDRAKYIYRSVLEDEFYDLRKDFNENRNLLRAQDLEAEKLRIELLATIDQLENLGNLEEESVDPETIERLRALGYTQ